MDARLFFINSFITLSVAYIELENRIQYPRLIVSVTEITSTRRV